MELDMDVVTGPEVAEATGSIHAVDVVENAHSLPVMYDYDDELLEDRHRMVICGNRNYAGGSAGLLMDLAANEKAVHADFFNDFEDLYDDEDLQ